MLGHSHNRIHNRIISDYLPWIIHIDFGLLSEYIFASLISLFNVDPNLKVFHENHDASAEGEWVKYLLAAVAYSRGVIILSTARNINSSQNFRVISFLLYNIDGALGRQHEFSVAEPLMFKELTGIVGKWNGYFLR